ncbi:family 20 glycosylhydrolase [Algoriphagus halophilus]|uniref:beta-N-acetylhexosaminidase n=1 Tax=Algoriphagus halophilus TaxID=226505 RepID=A0A1N6D828_9BACT|nr:family 20 glycosylhydrolase [Algoriphagus halophilus]SIN66939.1 Glycosyl hydrolase family 20, domain 2 [Algoriphagus halophilus]
MKFTRLIHLFLLLAAVAACQPKLNTEANFNLLPIPARADFNGASSIDPSSIRGDLEKAKNEFTSGGKLEAVDAGSIELVLNSSLNLKHEGYQLSITSNDVLIQSNSEAGLWYGLMTLDQITQDSEDQEAYLPRVEILDEPALAYRAIQLDVKHHLEQKEYYYELMDRLAALKINGIIIEIEDKLGYELQPVVASSDAFSIAEWKAISDYAMARNIRISPLVQGLGHASFILKHPEYEELRDDPASDWAFNPLNEKTYEVQFDLYTDALKAFPHATYLHVGGDEVHTTGRNSGKSPLELQLIWLNKVSKYAEDRGLTPIFWDDMPLKNAGVYSSIYNSNLTAAQVDSIWAKNEINLNKFVDLFPKNCVYMRWNYSMPESPGNDQAMKWFTENGFKVMGATAGQTRWNLMPLENSNTANIRDFALSSIDNEADGLLLTLWDDDSPLFELYQRGIATFAEYTWSGEKRSEDQLHTAFRQRMFGPKLASGEFAFVESLEGPVAFWKNALLDGKDRNRLRRIEDPIQEAVIELPDLDTPGTWTEKYQERVSKAAENLEIVEEVLSKIEASKKAAKRNQYNLEAYEQVAKAVQFTNQALITLAKLDHPSGEERAIAKAELAGMEAQWNSIESELEKVYGKTRALNKPDDYVLDQDHHVHLANQAKRFSDWQFYVEDLFLEKIKE